MFYAISAPDSNLSVRYPKETKNESNWRNIIQCYSKLMSFMKAKTVDTMKVTIVRVDASLVLNHDIICIDEGTCLRELCLNMYYKYQ